MVLLPVRSVGVMGDQRTYQDGRKDPGGYNRGFATADWARLPHDLLGANLEPHRQRSRRNKPRGV